MAEDFQGYKKQLDSSFKKSIQSCKENFESFVVHALPKGLRFVGVSLFILSEKLKEYTKPSQDWLDEALASHDTEELLARLQTADLTIRKEIIRAFSNQMQQAQKSHNQVSDEELREEVEEKKLLSSLKELDIDAEVQALHEVSEQLGLGKLQLTKDSFEDYFRILSVMQEEGSIASVLPYEPRVSALAFFIQGLCGPVILSVFKLKTSFHFRDIRRMLSKVFVEERSGMDLGFSMQALENECAREEMEEKVCQMLGCGKIYPGWEELDRESWGKKQRVWHSVSRSLNKCFPMDVDRSELFNLVVHPNHLDFLEFLSRDPEWIDHIVQVSEGYKVGKSFSMRPYLKGVLGKIQEEKGLQQRAKEINQKLLPKALRFFVKGDFVCLDLQMRKLLEKLSSDSLDSLKLSWRQSEKQQLIELENKEAQEKVFRNVLDTHDFKDLAEQVQKKVEAIQSVHREFSSIAAFMKEKKEELYLDYDAAEGDAEAAIDQLAAAHKQLMSKRKTLERIRSEMKKKYEKVNSISSQDLAPLKEYLKTKDLSFIKEESISLQKMNNIFSDCLHLIEKGSSDLANFKNNLNLFVRAWYKADEDLKKLQEQFQEVFQGEEFFSSQQEALESIHVLSNTTKIQAAYEESLSFLEEKVKTRQKQLLEEIEELRRKLRYQAVLACLPVSN